MASILLILGVILFFVAALWVAFLAFGAGEIWWGLGCLFVPIVFFIYGAIHYEECRIPIGVAIVGILLRIGGAALV